MSDCVKEREERGSPEGEVMDQRYLMDIRERESVQSILKNRNVKQKKSRKKSRKKIKN